MLGNTPATVQNERWFFIFVQSLNNIQNIVYICGMKRFWDIFRRKAEPAPQQPQPTINYQLTPPQQPVQSFVVDAERHKVVMAILQGLPFFAVYQRGTEVATASCIDSRVLSVGLQTMATKNKDFAEDLLNLVIDINTQNGTKTPAERKTE